MYTILHLGQALAQNIQTMLISRFLGGFFAVAPLVNGGGSYRFIPALNPRLMIMLNRTDR
jgi:hypothetical protein